MSEKDLRDIIAQVLTEMNVSDGATASAVEAAVAGKASPQNGTEIEDGCWDDVAAVDLRTQYLVENPVAKEAYYDRNSTLPAVWVLAKLVPVIRHFRYWNSVQHILQHRTLYLMM